MPGLEERCEDIPELARHFIQGLNETQNLPARPLGEDAAAMLQTMALPGNVRQLRNVIERVLILGDGNGPTLRLVNQPRTRPRTGALFSLARLPRCSCARPAKCSNGNT